MCRLVGITIPSKRMLAHQLMLYGAAEPNQKDGWGITDGSIAARSADGFNETGSIRAELDESKFWLGHVRNASYGTDVHSSVSHPYKFKTFLAAHNGAFEEVYVPPELNQKQYPNSDSFRAFYFLKQLLRKNGVVKAEHLLSRKYLLAEWLGWYGSETTFAVGLLFEDGLLFLKDQVKPLWVMETENGSIIHTSKSALQNAVDFENNFGAQYLEGEVRELPEKSITWFSYNQECITEELPYEFVILKQKRRKKVTC
jgi:hypothetical protein